jgi:hypothetical protein
MEKYFKYKRVVQVFTEEEKIQEFLDSLISEGWEIIHYQEGQGGVLDATISWKITVLLGKKQSNIL